MYYIIVAKTLLELTTKVNLRLNQQLSTVGGVVYMDELGGKARNLVLAQTMELTNTDNLALMTRLGLDAYKALRVELVDEFNAMQSPRRHANLFPKEYQKYLCQEVFPLTLAHTVLDIPHNISLLHRLININELVADDYYTEKGA
jgi:hypothetical protein